MLLPLLSVLMVTEVISDKKNLTSLAESETRIVGGTVVEPPHKYPFQVRERERETPGYISN